MKLTVHAYRHLTALTVLGALCLTLVAGTAYASPDDKDREKEAVAALRAAETEIAHMPVRDAATWKLFSKNLVKAIQSDTEGLKLAALQMVIRYGEQVDVDAAVFDVVRLYRNHSDTHVRQLAIVTLGAMKHGWAMDFLTRSARFEKDPVLQKTIRAVVASYQAEKAGA